MNEGTPGMAWRYIAVSAWIVANQLGCRTLTPSQKAALALELEKQLATEAKKKDSKWKSALQKVEKSESETSY